MGWERVCLSNKESDTGYAFSMAKDNWGTTGYKSSGTTLASYSEFHIRSLIPTIRLFRILNTKLDYAYNFILLVGIISILFSVYSCRAPHNGFTGIVPENYIVRRCCKCYLLIKILFLMSRILF